LFSAADDAPRVIEDEKELRKKRIEKKRQLKMKFDQVTIRRALLPIDV
jgi:hypothetical protein